MGDATPTPTTAAIKDASLLAPARRQRAPRASRRIAMLSSTAVLVVRVARPCNLFWRDAASRRLSRSTRAAALRACITRPRKRSSTSRAPSSTSRAPSSPMQDVLSLVHLRQRRRCTLSRVRAAHEAVNSSEGASRARTRARARLLFTPVTLARLLGFNPNRRALSPPFSPIFQVTRARRP